MNFFDKNISADNIDQQLVDTPTLKRARTKRRRRFVKGPIPLPWVRDHCKDPAFRLLLVIKAWSAMLKSDAVKLSADLLRDAGIGDRQMAYRALATLESMGTIEVVRLKGRRPSVKLLD